METIGKIVRNIITTWKLRNVPTTCDVYNWQHGNK